MNTKKDYYFETENVNEIINKILDEGVNNNRKYYAAGLLIGFLLLLVILLFIYMNDMGKSTTKWIPVIMGFLGTIALFLLIRFMNKDDNRKYRHRSIREESLRESLKPYTESKRDLHNYDNAKCDAELINKGFLYHKEGDIELLDFHINNNNGYINENKKEPLFLKGSVSFFTLLISFAFQISLVVFDIYKNLDSTLFALSILIFLVFISLYALAYVIAIIYRDIKNRKIVRLKRINRHLNTIKLKRLHEKQNKVECESSKDNRSKFQQIMDILFGQ